MAETQLKIGQKVKYLYGGKWQKGKVHGIKTHEDENGIVIKMSYLVDTGEVDREEIMEQDIKGKVTKTYKHPVQIEIETTHIKAL